jgi:endonuclease G
MDNLAPAEDQARLEDYSRSGFDLGHLAPNQDFAWDVGEQKDTFSFANVASQLPGLNRYGWERGEEIVRAWALHRGDLEVYIGPIIDKADATIGSRKVNVPIGFFKIVIDRKNGSGLGFVMPQAPIAKGPIRPFIRTIHSIEDQVGIRIPLPSNFHQSETVWSYDLKAWRNAHSRACR